MASSFDRQEWIFSFLSEAGFRFTRHGKGEAYKLLPSADKSHPLGLVLVAPLAELNEYVDRKKEHSLARAGKDSEEDTLGLVALNILEEISVDHGDGCNYTRSLGFRRKNGVVEFFVDSFPPPVVGEWDPDSPLEWTAERPSSR